jgi:hypothetical protein
MPVMTETTDAIERMEVARPIQADAHTIFEVVRSPAGHVAIDSSGMLQDFTGQPAAKVGDEFTIHMDRESLNDFPMGKYDVRVSFVTFEPDREVAWAILGGLDIGHVYGYRLEPLDDGSGGTLVTSYYDWSTISDDWKAAGIFPVISELALRGTLGILARTVARGYPGSA